MRSASTRACLMANEPLDPDGHRGMPAH